MISLLVCLLAVPVWAEDVPRPVLANNAVLVGWDGAHRDHVKKLLQEGRLPNLKKLIDEGTLVDVEVTSGATDTKAGWTQILTGYKPAVTGVYNNGRYRDVPAGYSIFERLRSRFGADRMATVAVIGKKQHCGEINPPFKKPYDPAQNKPAKAPTKPGRAAARKARGRIVEENGSRFLVFDGSPYYTMHNNVDEWHFGLIKDEKVGDRALEMLDRYGKKPFFFFVHFGEVDHQGHRFGEPSREYDEAIVSGDRQLGRIVDRLKQLGVYEKTLIYVTADHGFNIGAKHHRKAPYIFLGTNDKKVIRDGTRADITPTILDRLGVNIDTIRPQLDGKSLARLAAKLPTPPEKSPAQPDKHSAKAVPTP
jgi:hypothetical protein